VWYGIILYADGQSVNKFPNSVAQRMVVVAFIRIRPRTVRHEI